MQERSSEQSAARSAAQQQQKDGSDGSFWHSLSTLGNDLFGSSSSSSSVPVGAMSQQQTTHQQQQRMMQQAQDAKPQQQQQQQQPPGVRVPTPGKKKGARGRKAGAPKAAEAAVQTAPEVPADEELEAVSTALQVSDPVRAMLCLSLRLHLLGRLFL
jgi:hypothetical protein